MLRQMKRILILLVLYGLSVLSGISGPVHAMPGSQKEEKNVSTINSQKLEGTVEVSFKINETGKVDILNIQSTNPELIDYVVRKLKQIDLNERQDIIGKTIHYRFVFKKQA